jgi:hypothetical protein
MHVGMSDRNQGSQEFGGSVADGWRQERLACSSFPWETLQAAAAAKSAWSRRYGGYGDADMIHWNPSE